MIFPIFKTNYQDYASAVSKLEEARTPAEENKPVTNANQGFFNNFADQFWYQRAERDAKRNLIATIK